MAVGESRRDASGTWFRRAIYGLFALGAAGAIGLAALLGQFLLSARGRAALGEAGRVTKEVVDARFAAGAAELRAAGCAQAFAFEGSPRAAESGGASGGNGTLSVAICEVGLFGTALRCDDLAAIYVEAAAPSAGFQVLVRRPTGRELCHEWYESTGARGAEREPDVQGSRGRSGAGARAR